VKKIRADTDTKATRVKLNVPRIGVNLSRSKEVKRLCKDRQNFIFSGWFFRRDSRSYCWRIVTFSEGLDFPCHRFHLFWSLQEPIVWGKNCPPPPQHGEKCKKKEKKDRSKGSGKWKVNMQANRREMCQKGPARRARKVNVSSRGQNLISARGRKILFFEQNLYP
jgi:hypothetical protein